MGSEKLKQYGLSKSRILLHQQCPKRLWLKVHRPELEEVDDDNQARFATGTYVGEIAQQLYPDGIMIDGGDLKQAINDTQEVLANKNKTVFEATLQNDGLLIRADLLIPSDKGYRMVEVKSSTSVKDYHLIDAAIQKWVADQSNVNLSSVEIAHIDNQFVYPGDNDYQGLFNFADVSEKISEITKEVPIWIKEARSTLSSPTEPAIAVGKQCSDPFECSFLSYCSPVIEDADSYPPEILPYSGKLAATLRQEGYSDLRDIPEGRLENWKHQRVWRATKSGQPELDEAAGKALATLPYPRYYIDFETINPAIPIWKGTRPFMQVPFQWSCHIESEKGKLEHYAYLAQGNSDPRRPFAESLLQAVGEDGPVFVYNASFERSRIQELADYYPDLTFQLEALIDRSVDLLPIAREHYYHHEMRGSWSIKSVLPTIAPDLDYGNLDVANGGMAQEAFSEMMHHETSIERKEQLYNSLLLYCERDTLAMVRIAHHFENGL